MEHEPLNELQMRLAQEYPGWHFWRAEKGTGSLMATRKAHITDDQVNRGLARTLPMGITEALEPQLVRQAAIERELAIEPALA